MESITYLKNLSIPPKKLRMLLPRIKKMTPVEAVNVLFYTPTRPARLFYKAIKSAIANAKQTLKVSDDLLQFKVFTIEEGNKLKRYNAGSRGSAKPFKKRNSHVKIILEEKKSSEPKLATSTQTKKTKVQNEKKLEKEVEEKKVTKEVKKEPTKQKRVASPRKKTESI